MTRRLGAALLGACALAGGTAHAQTVNATTMTYQGRLDDAGLPANGTFDMTFSLADSDTCSGSGLLEAEAIGGVSVVDGLFTVELTYSSDLFNGTPRWLDIVVDGQRLCPRTPLTAAPFATHTRGLWVDDTGAVGVRTETPQAPLDIQGNQPHIRLQDDSDPAAYSEVRDSSFARLAIEKYGNPGATIDINPIPLDTSVDADVRFFRSTDTTGRKRIRLYRGDGSDTVQGQLGVDDQPTFFGLGSGNVGVGTQFPSQKLDVFGDARINGNFGVGTVPSYPIHASDNPAVGEGVIVGQAGAGGQGYGVTGETFASSGAGILGIARSTSGSTRAVLATNNSTAGTAVRAHCPSTTGTTTAVSAEVDSPSGWAVYAEGGRNYFQGAVGINTETTSGLLTVSGTSAEVVTVTGPGSFDTQGRIRFQDTSGGVFIDNPVDGELRLHADGFGARRINATCQTFDVSGTLSKGGGSFKIDHPLDPENKYLYHSFVESPDMMNIYNGNVTTDAEGYAVVEMPGWFEALNRDFRYQLTVIDEADADGFVLAKITRPIDGNTFTLRTSAPHSTVSWQVTGVRQDAWAQANRIPVEVDKPVAERGRLLHPAAFGAASEIGVNHDPSVTRTGDR